MLLRLLLSLLLLLLGGCEVAVEEASSCAPCGDLLICDEDTGECVASICGNGKIETGETCDTGASNSDTLADACRTDCSVAGCGDQVIDTGEACDEGTSNSDTDADACRTTCVVASCGDGVVDSGEACDDQNQNDDDGCLATCACAAGYTGDQGTCADVDECGNGTHNCDTNATCSNRIGGFDCACNAGFSGDGSTCADIDECAGVICENGGTCTHGVGVANDYTCTCAAGYEGGGLNSTTCTDINECAGVDCGPGGTCTEEEGVVNGTDYTCTCAAGYEGGSLNTPCVSSVCAPFALVNSDRDTGNALNGNFGDVVQAECDQGFTASLLFDAGLPFNAGATSGLRIINASGVDEHSDRVGCNYGNCSEVMTIGPYLPNMGAGGYECRFKLKTTGKNVGHPGDTIVRLTVRCEGCGGGGQSVELSTIDVAREDFNMNDVSQTFVLPFSKDAGGEVSCSVSLLPDLGSERVTHYSTQIVAAVATNPDSPREVTLTCGDDGEFTGYRCAPVKCATKTFPNAAQDLKGV